jgi:NAD(P)-dependent dehydrogenase (short-subunit alcohol dehydrogenase family)
VVHHCHSGHVISISSSAGLAAGFEFVTAYAASKFGLEGGMESLHAEVAPVGITTTIVNPGFFRTKLLTEPIDTLRRELVQTPSPLMMPDAWACSAAEHVVHLASLHERVTTRRDRSGECEARADVPPEPPPRRRQLPMRDTSGDGGPRR